MAMQRLPFDPDRVAPPSSGSSPDGDAPLTVSQVANLVKTVLVEAVPYKLRVVGEISNFSDRAHWFFSLKDEQSVIGCVCFASSARKINFPVRDGMQVVATGRLDYYEAQGRLQFYVEKLEPVGVGALELRFRALCDELRKLGYGDVGRKKPLPVVPQSVAVVTSRSAAALQDVIHTTHKRWRGCRLYLYDVRVQGAEAAPEIAQAVKALSQHGSELGVEAIVLTRGGGSMEDLWAFNERIVADAIYKCRLPIVAAIGHETDTTIAELVADVRCATPTQAAMILVPDRKALQQQARQLAQRLDVMLRREGRVSRQRFEAALKHPIFLRPERIVSMRRDRLNALQRQLKAVGPQNVLERGYSMTLDAKGGLIRSVKQVRRGARVQTVVGDGRFVSDVVSSGEDRKQPQPVQRGGRKEALDHPGLFDEGN